MYARGTAASLAASPARLRKALGRRLLVAVVVALCACGSAAAATVRGATDPLQAQEWWLAAVGADQTTPPGPGVPLTIVDAGTDPGHPEFIGRPNTVFLNSQTVTGPGEFHGTFVASIAAAPANGVGIVGVYPDATLQLFDASPVPDQIRDDEAIAGIQEAAQTCPGVISLSFGGVETDPVLEDAILTAYHNGCLIVAAAGNGGLIGNPTTYPAAWPHVLTVAATDNSSQVTTFSTAGPTVDLAAPGLDIIGAVPLAYDPSGYEEGNGTSYAAPIVAAAAAWIWTVRPTLTVTQLADVLRQSARDIGAPGFDSSAGWGLLDIPAALAAPTPSSDTGEPNDDVDQVKPRRLFEAGEPPLTSSVKASVRSAGSLDQAEDPRDVYRIWVPANKTVRVSASGGGAAAARIWGPQTLTVNEGVRARRRDLKGTSVRAGRTGFAAYVEVLLTGRSGRAQYVLGVTAAKR
jgi:subtilisin family serine protease